MHWLPAFDGSSSCIAAAWMLLVLEPQETLIHGSLLLSFYISFEKEYELPELRWRRHLLGSFQQQHCSRLMTEQNHRLREQQREFILWLPLVYPNLRSYFCSVHRVVTDSEQNPMLLFPASQH